ncbi:DUF349 domain-containing protein [Adhaeribacter radiodurans]|uniref:DUF349 domain-containing protein n=1 Tax=Adhaeribacter radiodurans TaxID=2745197 RepID=A0A7L7LBK6_9BACT|nr:DUF349 domain-containing protein [Adhaeribacter radiodurans]QMU30216.1 DUF349 domain-containing protein [Adhaeribacter radiodurans]
MENKDLLEEAKKYGFIQDNQVWLKPFMNFPARQVGEVKEVEDESLQYFAFRFQTFQEKVNALIDKIATSENKGSFLMKVLHLKELVGKYDALGDFEAIHQQLTQAENEIKAAISKNRDKNLTTKIALIEEAEVLQDSIDWKGTTEKLKELRQNWIKTGPIDKALTDEIEDRFRNAVETFFKRKKEFYEDKQNMLTRTLAKYKALIAESEILKNSEDWEGTTKKLKDLQNQWKAIGGNLPRKTSTELWNTFRKAHNYFFERLKNKITATKVESKDRFFEDNLGKKKQLVAEAQGLLSLNTHEAVARAKELQAAWKKVGPVKGEESDRVWEQFIIACDKVFEISSLEHFMRKKYPNADRNNHAEQIHNRINALRDFIKSDKQELEVLETNLGKLSTAPNNDTFRTMIQGKIKNFNRKIKTKTELIELFKSKLNQQVSG